MINFTAMLSGGLVGIILGVVGSGGSIIAVPLLMYIVGMPSAHAAIGTSAVAVAFSAFANIVTKLRQGLVKWRCILVFSAAGLIGNFTGSSLAIKMNGQHLLIAFGILMVVVGMVMLLRRDAEGDPDVKLTFKTARLMLPWLVSVGFVVGALSGFFGIGGGFLIVPGLMMATGMPIANAIATSLIAVTIFGAATSANYAWSGLVEWTVAINFVGGGVVGGIVGTMIQSSLVGHKGLLNKTFACLVIAIGCFVFFKGL